MGFLTSVTDIQKLFFSGFLQIHCIFLSKVYYTAHTPNTQNSGTPKSTPSLQNVLKGKSFELYAP